MFVLHFVFAQPIAQTLYFYLIKSTFKVNVSRMISPFHINGDHSSFTPNISVEITLHLLNYPTLFIGQFLPFCITFPFQNESFFIRSGIP